MFLLTFGCAGSNQQNHQPGWVNQKLAAMSIEQKVGQMMVPAYTPRFYNANDEEFKRLLRLVKDYHVGGAMILRGMPYEVARSIERLQEAADLPLLILADMEWGLTMRVDESTRLPQNMGIGAANREDLAYEMGKITALEARAIGVQVGFAPVLDVNNNPDNVIINTRSFGEDPQRVARLGAAFIRGMQEHGVFATAKHFPGHGDTSIDSHLLLPTIRAPRERVRNVELPPFQAAVAAGVKGVMTAHITFSDFPMMEGRPATLDRYFIQDVLRQEMGFEGLIFTDAMNMGGIVEHFWSGDAAVMAVTAGADMILMSPNFEATFDFVVAAVKAGRIPVARIDESVKRILAAKLELGLDQKPTFDLTRLEEVIAHPQHLQIAEQISDASMTLVRDDKNVIPLEAERLDSVLVVAISDDAENLSRTVPLNQEVQKRIPNVLTATIDPRSTKEEIQKIISNMNKVDAIVAGIFVKWASSKGTITLPDTTVNLLADFFKLEKPLAVIAFGSPYVLRQLPQVTSYLCAYETVPLAIRSAVRAIFGEIPLTAKLPVTIPDLYKTGDGLERPARKMELVNEIKDDIFEEAYAVLEQAIADSIFPGAQVAIVHDGKLIASRGFGRQTYDPASPAITTETLYDIASLTKVVGTTVTAMNLWEKKRILLDIPIKSYLPEFNSGEKERVTLRHLLTHSAGLHWWTDLWNKVSNKEDVLNYIYQLPLDYSPGDSMVYSDLGIMLIGETLKTVTGKSLDELFVQTIFKPMGMNNTRFNPPKELRIRIAPTEIGGGMNRGLIHGEVHDENAYFLGGVAPQAGLFSTAEDLAAFAQMLLNGGIYRHQRLLSPATIKYWTTRQHIPPNSTRAIGWDTPADSASSAGDDFSPGSFGHTGFTGTSFWVDPNRKIAVILLTNRVYPSRERGGMYEVRRNFHNAVMKALLQNLPGLRNLEGL
jgi:beta-glucosidase-like glycosyl hydrolase/CubicO group peptidase (beta-lactamase class C family)